MWAIGTPGGLVTGEQLIRYHTLSVGLGIHFSTGLSQNKISFHQSGPLSINQLSICEHMLIYFDEQVFCSKCCNRVLVVTVTTLLNGVNCPAKTWSLLLPNSLPLRQAFCLKV